MSRRSSRPFGHRMGRRPRQRAGCAPASSAGSTRLATDRAAPAIGARHRQPERPLPQPRPEQHRRCRSAPSGFGFPGRGGTFSMPVQAAGAFRQPGGGSVGRRLPPPARSTATARDRDRPASRCRRVLPTTVVGCQSPGWCDPQGRRQKHRLAQDAATSHRIHCRAGRRPQASSVSERPPRTSPMPELASRSPLPESSRLEDRHAVGAERCRSARTSSSQSHQSGSLVGTPMRMIGTPVERAPFWPPARSAGRSRAYRRARHRSGTTSGPRIPGRRVPCSGSRNPDPSAASRPRPRFVVQARVDPRDPREEVRHVVGQPMFPRRSASFVIETLSSRRRSVRLLLDRGDRGEPRRQPVGNLARRLGRLQTRRRAREQRPAQPRFEGAKLPTHGCGRDAEFRRRLGHGPQPQHRLQRAPPFEVRQGHRLPQGSLARWAENLTCNPQDRRQFSNCHATQSSQNGDRNESLCHRARPAGGWAACHPTSCREPPRDPTPPWLTSRRGSSSSIPTSQATRRSASIWPWTRTRSASMRGSAASRPRRSPRSSDASIRRPAEAA